MTDEELAEIKARTYGAIRNPSIERERERQVALYDCTVLIVELERMREGLIVLRQQFEPSVSVSLSAFRYLLGEDDCNQTTHPTGD